MCEESVDISRDPFAGFAGLANEEPGEFIREPNKDVREERAFCSLRLAVCWRRLERGVEELIGGGKADAMVNAVAKINGLLGDDDQVDANLRRLSSEECYPTLPEVRDRLELAVCRMVVVLWIRIRFDGARSEQLIAELTEPPIRQTDFWAGFIRPFIVYGGLRSCAQCGRLKPPRDTEPACCEACRRDQLSAIAALDIAIGCDANRDSNDQSPLEVERFPQWRMWRRRLRNHLGIPDATDATLLEEWKCYVSEHFDMDEEQFLVVALHLAEELLPPASGAEKTKDGGALNKKQQNKSRRRQGRRTVHQVAGKDLAKYHHQAEVVTAWIRAGKPKRQHLAMFLASRSEYLSVEEWQRIRSNARSAARRYGYSADEIPHWFAALEKEVQLRENAGIFIREY